MKPIFRKDFSDKKILEKFSSTFTLSDMEIFIFPDLFYPLVLADIMSPILWEWRKDPWFHNIEKKSFTHKTNRIKQYIIQNFVFNLDLSTWGLTTKSREIERFRDFFDMDLLRQSNALFGYEGDKYYFDIDIRKHFGLDKYDSDIIPYWKTETVEAMEAFRHKENFTTGGGECVSLSALYAAAMFVVGRIPLEKIFLIATPLHSQNFIIEKDGLITNNRRIVTKNMWFNGTSLSAKARRAMENEKVTIVSNISGYIHTLYEEATIDREAYEWFSSNLREFMVTELTSQIFINFLRFKSRYKNMFQYRCECAGVYRYIHLEKMFEYEHSSKFSVSAETRESLMKEIEGDDFHLSLIQGKILLNDIEEMLDRHKGAGLNLIEEEFIKITGADQAEIVHDMFNEIKSFISTDPRIPASEKRYSPVKIPVITTESIREEIIDEIHNLSEESDLCMLTLYAYRQMDVIDWIPFVKAAIERNPVCLEAMTDKPLLEVYEIIRHLPDHSIYDGKRLAMPDEVWNFRRGDGIEKAFLLANYICDRDRSLPVVIEIDHKNVMISYKGRDFHFKSEKKTRKTVRIIGYKYEVE
jgi:hypothetical protein